MAVSIESRMKDMGGFIFRALELEGAYRIDSFHAGDGRGWFTKSFEEEIFLREGIRFRLSETFFSCSAGNVVRGLHFQRRCPQAKLVSVVQGRAWDVIVDLRPESVSFGRWACEELSAQNHRSLYVPRGFAHGFASLEDGTVMLYQCDGAYDRETDTGIRFDDPEIGIRWPVDGALAVHSQRDLKLMSLREYRKHPMEIRG